VADLHNRNIHVLVSDNDGTILRELMTKPIDEDGAFEIFNNLSARIETLGSAISDQTPLKDNGITFNTQVTSTN
jgi:predicted house-cleaning NTP pyrophosphatase (Maf/HAM1 superfamily)